MAIPQRRRIDHSLLDLTRIGPRKRRPRFRALGIGLRIIASRDGHLAIPSRPFEIMTDQSYPMLRRSATLTLGDISFDDRIEGPFGPPSPLELGGAERGIPGFSRR